jgi:hypothetical protein
VQESFLPSKTRIEKRSLLQFPHPVDFRREKRRYKTTLRTTKKTENENKDKKEKKKARRLLQETCKH